MSAATIDRQLQNWRMRLGRQPRRPATATTSLKAQIAIRTWGEWKDTPDLIRKECSSRSARGLSPARRESAVAEKLSEAGHGSPYASMRSRSSACWMSWRRPRYSLRTLSRAA